VTSRGPRGRTFIESRNFLSQIRKGHRGTLATGYTGWRIKSIIERNMQHPKGKKRGGGVREGGGRHQRTKQNLLLKEKRREDKTGGKNGAQNV